ncbi:SGNH hydrolase-type esterase domain-containing protein [Bisporella sp. PMI_857]|nr:SGNH hydrolase-type esterase domain-containing protein [Bisporella sp. PMI_857]
MFRQTLLLVLATFYLLAPASSLRTVHRRKHDDRRWVDIWASMPQLTEVGNLPPVPFNATESQFANSTIRQTVHLTLGASTIRLRLSNAFGVNDLPITGVTVALPVNGSSGVSAIQTNTLKVVTFSGNSAVTIPNGALAVSDPINIDVAAQSNLAITIYLATGQPGLAITSHPGSRTTSWFTFGNALASAAFTDTSTKSAAHWYFISAVEAWVPRESRALAIVGDSITDGRGSTTDGNNRWPDLLLANMKKRHSTTNIAILNQAAGGNRVLKDGLGPNALGRIDRDVLSHSGVEYVLLFEGVNDIGTADTSPAAQKAIGDRLIFAFQQIITRVQAFELPIFAATITPFSGNATIQPYSNPEREKTRQRVNKWIREEGDFDAVLDFDKWLRDPKDGSQLNPLYNGGDYLHPNVAGYQRIADVFPLGIFD